ncbi:MAG: YfjI family protein [Planctomycetota bacterium]
MSTAPNTVTGFYTDDLPAVANNITDVGEPGITSEMIAQMFACILGDDTLFQSSVRQIQPLHFRADEPDLGAVLQAMVDAHGRSDVRPSFADLQTAIIGRIHEEQRLNAGLVSSGLNVAIGEGGILSRIAHHQQNGCSPELGRSLVRRFLLERDVFDPISTIVLSSRTSAFGPGNQIPTNMTGLLHRASERSDEIDRDWGDGEPWGEPEPLDGPELPPFPVQALPPTLRRWVEAEATATQTPADLAAMLSLSVCAAAGAKLIEVQVRPGFCEPISIYSASIMDPGNRKSAVVSDAIAPSRQHERDAVEGMAQQLRAYEGQLSVLTARQKHLESRAAKAQQEDDRRSLMADAASVRNEIARLPRVVEPKSLIDDCTVEKVEQILSEQGGRIAVMSAEGGVFGLMTGRYSNSCNFDVYLKGHSGDEIRTDRLGRSPVFVQRPAITLALAVQPDVIRGLGEKAELRGKGLLARILYSLPRSLLGQRISNAPPVPAEVTVEYRRLVLTICGIARPGIPPQTQHLRLSDEAATCFQQFERDVEPRLGRLGDLADIQDWAGKLAGAVIRLAGILHLVEQAERRLHEPAEQQERIAHRERMPPFTPWETPISGTTLAAAVTIAQYLIPHAQAAFAMMGMAAGTSASVMANAWCALEWIRRNHRTRFTRRDLHQENRARFRKAADIEPVLELLEARNVVRPVTHQAAVGGKAGRKPSPRYEVNPDVFERRCGTGPT